MIRVAIRVGVQLLTILAPLFTMQWSLLDRLGYGPDASNMVQVSAWGYPVLFGPKPEVEFTVRAFISAAGLALFFIYEAVEFYIPRRNLTAFRKAYLAEAAPEWRKQLSDDIRINLMFGRRPWWGAWAFSYFQWTWSDGFKPHDRDVNMPLLASPWQGVCGMAYKTKRPQSVYFDSAPGQLSFQEKWLLRNSFRLWGPQISRTRELRGVISIPIVLATEGLSPQYKAVGVLNLDTCSESGAKLLKENENALAEYFHRLGKILGALRA
jgi:hypothetical protein